jgi:hypothetical protein
VSACVFLREGGCVLLGLSHWSKRKLAIEKSDAPITVKDLRSSES